jgi:hypothetical protein
MPPEPARAEPPRRTRVVHEVEPRRPREAKQHAAGEAKPKRRRVP